MPSMIFMVNRIPLSAFASSFPSLASVQRPPETFSLDPETRFAFSFFIPHFSLSLRFPLSAFRLPLFPFKPPRCQEHNDELRIMKDEVGPFLILHSSFFIFHCLCVS